MLSPPPQPPSKDVSWVQEKENHSQGLPSCRGLPGRGRRDPEARYSSYPTGSPRAAGLPGHIAPLSAGGGGSAGRQGPGRLAGALRLPPPPKPTSVRCTEPTISGLAPPCSVGMTNAWHANCPPRVAARLFVGPQAPRSREDPEWPRRLASAEGGEAVNTLLISPIITQTRFHTKQSPRRSRRKCVC